MKKNIEIMDIIDMTDLTFSKDLGNIMEQNPDYQKAWEEYNTLVKSLDRKIMMELEQIVIPIETIARNTAFNEGFKLGVRLIVSSMK